MRTQTRDIQTHLTPQKAFEILDEGPLQRGEERVNFGLGHHRRSTSHPAWSKEDSSVD